MSESEPPKSPYRSHRVADLDRSLVGRHVKLAGWIHRKRELGSIVFLELRDGGALLQCVLEARTEAFQRLASARLESVVCVEGALAARPSGSENAGRHAGDVELRVTALEIFSEADPLPFSIASDVEPPEELRLRYRFLDLRRERVRNNVLLRSKLVARLRELLVERDFVEVTTPILTSSSPEGARDF